ncbi:hypothetical protein LCGC14_3012930, partial [marine sediment metagenome]
MWFTDDEGTDVQLGVILSHDYDVHAGGVPYAELEYDDATSDPLIDADAASDGTETSAARKDHVHPKHHAKYLNSEAITAVEGESTLVLAGDVTVVGSGKSLEVINFKFETSTELTIDGSGDVTRTQASHNIDTNGGAGADNLDGIAGGADGMFLLIRPNNDARTVVVRHNQNAAATKNILLAGGDDATLDDIQDTLLLVYDSALDTNGAWVEISRSTETSAYTDADAISAVENEATLDLLG